MDVTPGKTGGVVEGALGSKSFSFEQQKELLLLQMAHDKMKYEAEQARISLERDKLSLLREGRLSIEAVQGSRDTNVEDCRDETCSHSVLYIKRSWFKTFYTSENDEKQYYCQSSIGCGGRGGNFFHR